MNIRIIFFTLLSFCSFNQLTGQEKHKLDSLWNAFKQATHDTTRIKAYLNIGDCFEYEIMDTALFYYQQALILADEALSTYPSTHSQTVSSLFLLKGKSLRYIGVVYHNQGSYDKAIEFYLKSLKIREELGDKNGMAGCYQNIGVVHEYQGSYDKAKESYLISLKIYEELGDKKGMSHCYSNIGIVYENQGNYDKAREYYMKALKIKEELGDKNGISMVYGNIASLHITLADSEKQQGVGGWVAHLDSALQFGNKAFKLAVEIGAVPKQNDAAENLQQAYTKLGRYKEALKYAEIFIETQDSMFKEEKTKALAEMGAKYETEKNNSRLTISTKKMP